MGIIPTSKLDRFIVDAWDQVRGYIAAQLTSIFCSRAKFAKVVRRHLWGTESIATENLSFFQISGHCNLLSRNWCYCPLLVWRWQRMSPTSGWCDALGFRSMSCHRLVELTENSKKVFEFAICSCTTHGLFLRSLLVAVIVSVVIMLWFGFWRHVCNTLKLMRRPVNTVSRNTATAKIGNACQECQEIAQAPTPKDLKA